MPAVEQSFPEPAVFAPRSGLHLHTVILLHGRGGSAQAFSQRLLQMSVPLNRGSEAWTKTQEAADVLSTTTLFESLPNAKFVFPCARRQRATVYRRSIVRQWFDDWHLDPELSSDVVDSRYDDGLQITSLGESIDYLCSLVAEEVKLVGSARNVIVGGFSQGAATSLVTGILWDGVDPLGGIIAMSGWLPYMKQMTDISSYVSGRAGDVGTEADDDELDLVVDPFESRVSQRHECTNHIGLDWLREEIELPVIRHSCPCALSRRGIPVLLCHGSVDRQVEHERGEQACVILPNLGLHPVSWNLHEGIGHDYSEATLVDVVQFLTQRLLLDANSLVRLPGEHQSGVVPQLRSAQS